MYPYTYKVSLRIFHPNVDPQTLTDTFGMQPGRAWKVGERRTTPNGTPLEGVYHESYWYSDFTAPDDSDFPAFLRREVEALSLHRECFGHIRETGGRVEFYVGLHAGGSMLGETLPYDLLGRLGQLGIDLGLDTIYARDRVATA